MFSSPTEALGQSRLRYQGHTGGAREGTHVAIVTRKAMILGNQGPALSSTDEVSQMVMTKKCFG